MSILLRPVTEPDLPTLFQHQADPEWSTMAAFPSRDREAFNAHWAKIMRDEAVIMRTILFENQIAGSLVNWEHDGEREVGYWLGREFWGKGIATQALMKFLEIVTIRPLVAHVARHNIGSRRVLEKCGFTLSKRGYVCGLEWQSF